MINTRLLREYLGFVDIRVLAQFSRSFVTTRKSGTRCIKFALVDQRLRLARDRGDLRWSFLQQFIFCA